MARPGPHAWDIQTKNRLPGLHATAQRQTLGPRTDGIGKPTQTDQPPARLPLLFTCSQTLEWIPSGRVPEREKDSELWLCQVSGVRCQVSSEVQASGPGFR
jgi:hypothetical protein